MMSESGSERPSANGNGHAGAVGSAGDRFPLALAGLENALRDACRRQDEWPAQIAAAVYAGVDFAITNPTVARALTIDAAVEGDSPQRYQKLIDCLTGFLQVKAPRDRRLPPTTDEALVAGVVGVVGDHIRIGRVDRLAELRPELVLLTLLPYLGFADAQRWSNRTAPSNGGEN